jgi:hypothetical protein
VHHADRTKLLSICWRCKRLKMSLNLMNKRSPGYPSTKPTLVGTLTTYTGHLGFLSLRSWFSRYIMLSCTSLMLSPISLKISLGSIGSPR